MKYKVVHKTEYRYKTPASLCHNLVCQGPGVSPHQRVGRFQYVIQPEPSFQSVRKDFFENQLLYFAIQKPHHALKVEVRSEVRLSRPGWVDIDPGATPPWEEVAAWLQRTEARNDTRQFYLESEHVRFITGIRDYARQSFTGGRPIMAAMLDLNSRIYRDFKFSPAFTDISTPLEHVFAHKKGVCQDFAHFSLACVRSLGLAARYISGYIETIPPPGKPKLAGADASHAWTALFIPGLDWVEFDATNNLLVNDQHIYAATGRDFADVVPLKGVVYSSGGQEMQVSVDVQKC